MSAGKKLKVGEGDQNPKEEEKKPALTKKVVSLDKYLKLAAKYYPELSYLETGIALLHSNEKGIASFVHKGITRIVADI